MTQEEKLEILAGAEVRAYDAIKAWDGPSMGSENFVHLLHVVDQLRWMQEIVAKPEQYDEPVDFITPATPKQDPDPAPAPETKQTPPPAPAESGMTKAEMVSKLTTFQTNGVAIDKVMESMGYTKLSQVPANQYDKLLDLCQEALDGEG